jgi:hypothetical protein
MRHRFESAESFGERLVSAADIAELFGISERKALMLPLKQYRISERIIRFRLSEVYEYFGIDHPNT